MKLNKTRNKITNNKTKKRVFNDQHYNSNDGMLTTVWGPCMWHVLHTMSFNYPVNPTKNDKIHYRNYIISLKYVLPCGKCRTNLSKNFKKLPLQPKDLQSRESFSKYIYHLHEIINDMLGKKSNLTYEDVKERYEHFRARCNPEIEQKIVDFKLQKKKMNKTMKHKKENGCTEPLFGEKSKCILHIVPVTKKCETFKMDDNCKKRKTDTQ
jgi:hypothetical protein